MSQSRQIRHHRFSRFIVKAALCALVLLAAPIVAEACPTCKEGMAQGDPAYASMVRGYFWSIIFMMSMPFVIFFGLGGYFYYEVRKARSAQSRQAMVPAGR